jgi:hypothetical protein
MDRSPMSSAIVILFDREDGEPSLSNFLYDFDQLRNNLRRKTFRLRADGICRTCRSTEN